MNDVTVLSAEDVKKWWYDEGGKFWVESDSGDEFVSLPARAFEFYLRKKDYSPRPVSGSALSSLENEILSTMTKRRVTWAGALAGYQKGIHHFDDTRALVTRSTKLIEPVQGEFATLAAFMEGLLASGPNQDEPQVEYFWGWHQHALRSLYSGRPSKGLAIALAGPAGCGKTLLKDLLRMTFGNRECMPYRYMTGDTAFNKDLIEACLWSIDDEAATTRVEDRIKFGAKIKMAVANTAIRIERKGADAGEINPFRRLVINVNDEPDRLLVLPPLDDDIQDKISLFHCLRGPEIMPTQTEQEKQTFYDKLVSELPAYIYHLLHCFELPRNMLGRFGVAHYHNPEIKRQLFDISPEIATRDMLQKGIFGKYHVELAPKAFTGTAAQIREQLIAEDSKLSNHERQQLPEPPWIGKRIAKLARRYPEMYILHRHADRNEWEVRNWDHSEVKR